MVVGKKDDAAVDGWVRSSLSRRQPRLARSVSRRERRFAFSITTTTTACNERANCDMDFLNNGLAAVGSRVNKHRKDEVRSRTHFSTLNVADLVADPLRVLRVG